MQRHLGHPLANYPGYTLARSIYENSSDHPLSEKLLEGTVYSTAMTAYDNASNPNRTRGGLKKCDEM
jgi:protein transport protein SEC39